MKKMCAVLLLQAYLVVIDVDAMNSNCQQIDPMSIRSTRIGANSYRYAGYVSEDDEFLPQVDQFSPEDDNRQSEREHELASNSIFLPLFELESGLAGRLVIDTDNLDVNDKEADVPSPKHSPEPKIKDQRYINTVLELARSVLKEAKRVGSLDPQFKITYARELRLLIEQLMIAGASCKKYNCKTRIDAVDYVLRLRVYLQTALAKRADRIKGKSISPYGRGALFNK